MKPGIARLSLLTLLAGCASSQPMYQVGGTGPKQNREDAEREHAARTPVRVPAATVSDTPPKVLSSPFPDYPQDWRNQNITGTVVVVFTVDENGAVSNPTVVGSPSPKLAALVLHAILQWKFQPALKDGTPVRVRAQQEFEFKLD